MPLHDQARSTLGVREGATREEVEQAYRRLAMDAHPDRGGDTQRMAEINAARDALLASSDPIAPTVLRPAREANCYSHYSGLHRGRV